MDPEEIQGLSERAGEGDREALGTLLEHFLPELRAFVRLRVGPMIRARESESDLVQSVCREVLDHAGRFRHPSESAFKRWLYTTALRKILGRRDYYRAEKRDALREEGASGSESELLACYQRFSTPSHQALVRDEVERIEGAFDSLSDEQREVVTLAHFVGLSRAEIAAQTGRNEGTVRMILHRALAKVAWQLGTPEGDGEG